MPLVLLLGGGVAEKDSDIVVVGESEELDNRCLPMRMFSTVKLEMDLFGCFFEELEDWSDQRESSREGEAQPPPPEAAVDLPPELLATAVEQSSLLDEEDP